MKITFGKLKNFISEDNGEKISKAHPCILVENENDKKVAFLFTHEQLYGIEGRQEAYSYEIKNEMSNTAVRKEDLQATYKYYDKIVKETDKFDIQNNVNIRKEYLNAKKILSELSIGYTCYHPIEKSKTYLEQEVAVFKNKEDFIKIHNKNDESFISTTVKNNDYVSNNIIKKNVEKFRKGMAIIEKALINDRLFFFDTSFSKEEKQIDNPDDFSSLKEKNNLRKEKYDLKDRIDLAFAISIERHIQALPFDLSDKERKSKIVEYNLLSKEKYIQMIIDNKINKDDEPKLKDIQKIAKVEDCDKIINYYENEIKFREKIITKLSAFRAQDIEKGERLKSEIKTFTEARTKNEKELYIFLKENPDVLEEYNLENLKSEISKDIFDELSDNFSDDVE